MSLDAIPLFAMLKSKLGYETQRQRVLAENVANSDTAGFAPRDLKPFSFAGAMQAQAHAPVTAVRTSAMHITAKPRAGSGVFRPEASPDTEAKLDGNQVVLEEEMMKMSDSRGAYDAAITLYQQSLAMLRTAARAPGR